MKNQIVKLLPLCLLCWIFFSGCQAAFSTGSPVSCTMQLPSGGQVEWKDGALMKQMSDLLASVRPEETLSFPEEQSYQLTFYQEDGDLSFLLVGL